ncbi:MAG: amidohydrolase [Synergistes sp.]|nr:amidohydrolase [Clostridia bacterium]MBQ9882552.1 amidohydrolase [Synergistes sp.]
MTENSQKYLDILTKHRRYLHTIPEASFKEEKTCEYICKTLDALGIPYERLLDTGVLAHIKVDEKLDTFAFRADMDALPVLEDTGREFSSKHEGFMHACGHDAHMAVLLTFAEFLSANRSRLRANAALIFQPAEEGYGGSLKMIDAGVLEKAGASEIYSFHVSPLYPKGKVYISLGSATACDLAFDVRVHGKASHGAIPQNGRDAIVAASALVCALQSIVSRENDPHSPLALTIGTMRAGTKRNVVADEAVLECAIRCSLTEDAAAAAYEKVKRICAGTAAAFGVDIETDIHHFYGAVKNDELCVSRIEKAFAPGEVERVPPLVVSEDFFAFTKKLPAAMFLCGVRDEKCGFVHPLHADKFDLNEDALLYALETYIRLII